MALTDDRFVVTPYSADGFKQSVNKAMAGLRRFAEVVNRAATTFAHLDDAVKARNAFIADGGDVRSILAIEEMFDVVHE